MTLQDALHQLIQCVATEKTVTLGWHDIKRWSSGAVELFEHAGLLKKKHAAQMIQCNGCAENCYMPVDTRKPIGGGQVIAFITCTEPADQGRIDVAAHELDQWIISDAMLAHVTATLLGINKLSIEVSQDGRWELGTFKGKRKYAGITLNTEHPIKLSFSGHAIPLHTLLFIQSNAVTLDIDQITHLTDNPLDHGESPAQRKDRFEKRINELKKSGVKAFIKTLAAEEGLSVARIKAVLADNPKSVATKNTLNPLAAFTASKKHPSSRDPKAQ